LSLPPEPSPLSVPSAPPNPAVPPVPATPLPNGGAAAPADRLAQLLNEANEHEQAGRLDAAESVLKAILAEIPEQAGALHMLGIVSFKKGQIAEAAQLMERSIARAPANALYYRNICEVYRVLGRYDEAVAAGERAVSLAPQDPHCYNNLGVLHYHRLALDEAIASAERAIALMPDFAGAHFGMAEAFLLRGDFARGWEEYEWRFKLANAPRLMPASDKPQWDGSQLAPGKLMLIADQGYGDVIQFCRYIGWAAQRAPEPALACSLEILPIVNQQPGLGMVFDHWDKRPDFEAYCPLSGLPRLHGTRLNTIPAEIPYVRADPQKSAAWAARLAALVPQAYKRIGIAWAGRPTHTNDRNRSTALATFAPLSELSGVALVSLQKGPPQAQIGNYWGRAPLVNLGPEIRDYGDTIAIIDNLDLVVTVDTSVGHLSGAMGKEVWILLPFAPDWRWLLDRADSPWYPTVRLFRQPAPGRWDRVVAAVTAALS
jgi:tetratricopeptide (TPR) repeat protein